MKHYFKNQFFSRHRNKDHFKRRTFIIFFLLLGNALFAQTDIRGKVTSATTGLEGVTVRVKGEKTATQTDIDGNYLIRALGDGTLIFSYVGSVTQEIPIYNRSNIDVELQLVNQQLNDIVVVGYGTQRKKDLTGSIAVIDAKSLENRNQPSVGQALQGLAPGVRVSGPNMPGQNPRIEIRGVGTINNNSPLFVVDGMYVDDITNITPDDVETMQVLKDASASAIYGSRAANGVIVITTKKGRANNKLNINFDGFQGVSNIHQRLDVMDREQYQALMRAAAINDGKPIDAANDPNSSDFVSDIDTHWQDEAWQPGPFSKYSIALSGGSAVSKFRISGDYNHRKSTFTGQGPDFQRYHFTINTDQSYKKLKFSQTLLFSKTDGFPLTSTHAYSAVINVLKSLPTLGIYDPNSPGGYAGTESKHGVIDLNMIGWNNLIKRENKSTYVLGGFNASYEINKYLSLRGTTSYNYTAQNNRIFTPVYRIGYFFTNTEAKLDEFRNEFSQFTANGVLNFKRDFGKHNIDAIVGAEYYKEDFDFLYAGARGYSQPYAMVLDAGPSGKANAGSKQAMAYMSEFARVNYNYADRYLLTASLRRDANSRFAKQNRVGYFPSVAAAWNVNNESFIKLPEVISALKIRSSYGELGNSSMGNYLYQPVLNVQGGYVFGGNYQQGATVTRLVNQDVIWESTKSFNIGMDLSMLNNTVILTGEYYRNTTNNILFAVDIPLSNGAVGAPTVNSAGMRNSGIEIGLTYQKPRTDKLNFSFSGNISTVTNVVTQLGNNVPIILNSNITEVGHPIAQIYGWQVDRLFQSADDVSKSAYQPYAQAGDIKFKDLNNDNIIDDKDKVVLGNSIPKFTYGFGLNMDYMNFDLYAQFYGVYGNSIFNVERQILERSGRERENQLTSQGNFWTPTNTNTDV
ncbi:MAG TPA: SusC/RagA family TonB-linked outer membrane protein, partial [Arachidicoccus sp.]|nr:SusC/RagA family TonB-linked outer membrane protein [Arachidicoccus sp.]